MDPDVKNVTKEATRLVSKAAEIFVHWFAQRVYRNAEEEGKRAVAVNHFRKAQLDPCGELFFLKIWEMMEEEEVLMPMPLQPKPAPAASTGECPNGCQRKAEASPTSPKLEGTQGPTQEVPVSPSSSSSSSPSLSSVSSPSLSLASIDMDDKDSAEQTNAKTEEDDPVKCMMASVYYDTSDGEIQVVEERWPNWSFTSSLTEGKSDGEYILIWKSGVLRCLVLYCVDVLSDAVMFHVAACVLICIVVCSVRSWELHGTPPTIPP